MKISLIALVFSLSFSVIGFADDIVPLNITHVAQSFGCGVRPPNGQGCPATVETEITISLAAKKGCEKSADFVIQVVQAADTQELTIYRKAVDCLGASFPPEFDTLDLSSSDLLLNKPIRLMNPLATMQFARP